MINSGIFSNLDFAIPKFNSMLTKSNPSLKKYHMKFLGWGKCEKTKTE